MFTDSKVAIVPLLSGRSLVGVRASGSGPDEQRRQGTDCRGDRRIRYWLGICTGGGSWLVVVRCTARRECELPLRLDTRARRRPVIRSAALHVLQQRGLADTCVAPDPQRTALAGSDVRDELVE
jgi:hypothetical protein